MNSGKDGVSFPKTISCEVSTDGKNWEDFGETWVCPDPSTNKLEIAGLVAATIEGYSEDVKFVRITSERNTHEFWAEILAYGK